ncbi:MAG: hypothetical protein ACNA7H_06715 [Desulfotignum sp.]
MKTIKFLFLLIILVLLGLLVYQNSVYFTTGSSLALDLKFTQWTVPGLPNWAFWGLCFGLGLLVTGIKGLVTAYGLGREIKIRDAQIAELTIRNNDLKSRLDVFIHDPYIKKGLSDRSLPVSEKPAASDSGSEASGGLAQNESGTQASDEKPVKA